MTDCPSCHQPNVEGASFCIHCGGALSGVPSGVDPATLKGQPQDPQQGTVPGRPISGAFTKSPGMDPPPPPGDLSVGDLVDGKYSIQSVLGEGGMGVVYLADDIHTQVPVVVKAIRSEYAHRQEFRDRILAEGRALATIDHNNVVRLNAVVVETGALCLVMQFIEGESLDKTIARYVAQQAPMPVDLVLKIFHQILDGIGAAHDAGVIHRDLKPANILIRGRDAVAKVTDFGIAKAEEDAQAGRGQTKGIIGSLLYMAPEQIKGRRDLDKRVDIYGLGILLYEMLVGRVPFDAPSEFEIMKLHLEGQVPFVSRMRRDVPLYVDAVIQKACAKKREDRFASTAEMAAALRAGQAVPIPKEAPTPPYVADAGIDASVASVAATAEDPAAFPDETKPSRLGWILAFGIVVLLGAGGLLGAYLLGYLDPLIREPAVSIVKTTVSSPSSSQTGSEKPAAIEDPLEALVGAWRSDTGLVYDAVKSANTLEFRIRSAKGMERDGYVDGEERFILEAIPGQRGLFSVKDKIRPALPSDLTYDLSRSRSSCQEVRTEVNGQPLRARFDGSRLTVEVAKIAPLRSMFLREGTRVYGCIKLRDAKASIVQSALERN